MSNASPKRGKCPICGAVPNHHYRPFCSRRCADVDLARWLGGAYSIPGEEEGRTVDTAAAEEAADDVDQANGEEHRR
jgi:endogenous inhibitor of DNA gyrase (YacG/DUF329 family)